MDILYIFLSMICYIKLYRKILNCMRPSPDNAFVHSHQSALLAIVSGIISPVPLFSPFIS